MRQGLHVHNNTDDDGNPAGGSITGIGLSIVWQNGPTVDPETGEKRKSNGCFVETVIQAAIERLRYYQETKFSCRQNAIAITKLEEAQHWLQDRTREREEKGIEGSHVVDVVYPSVCPNPPASPRELGD